MGDPDPEPAAAAPPLLHVKTPPPLQLRDNMVEEWKMFKQLFKNYQVITALDKRDKAYQCAVFLHCAGTAGIKIYNSLEFAPAGPGNNPPAEDKEDVATLIKKFDEYIIGETNETYERYKFNKRDQNEGETVEAYISALKELASSCSFCDCLKDSLIRDRLVMGIRDNQTRKRLLQKRKLTFKEAADICKGAEVTQQQMESMGATVASTVSKVQRELRQGNQQVMLPLMKRI